MAEKNIVLLFGGQGSQKVGMGHEFFKEYEEVREKFALASEILDEDVSKLCFEANDRLNSTEYTQIAIFLVSACIYEVFCKLAPKHYKVVYGLGHSLGEFSALFSSGALDFEKGLHLVKRRGELMRSTCLGYTKGEASMMVVLGLEENLLQEFCAKKREEGYSLWCANYNTPEQVVLAGLRDDLMGLEVEIKGLGAKRTLMLPMNIASHCPILEGMVAAFHSLLEKDIVDSFAFPIISNVTAQAYSSKVLAVDLLSKQLISPVLYRQSIEAMDGNIDFMLECGSSVLKGLNKKITSIPTLSIQTPKDLEEVIGYIKGD